MKLYKISVVFPERRIPIEVDERTPGMEDLQDPECVEPGLVMNKVGGEKNYPEAYVI